MLLVIVFIFLFGLAIGSFVNVIIYRTLHGESPWVGRSKCPKCKRTIKAYDNIPLLSFIILGGKCRYCRKRISLSYPVIEFLTAILFIWWYLGGSLFFHLTQSPFSYIQPIFWLIVGVLLLIIFFTDLLYGVIPDVMVGLMVVVALFYRLFLASGGVMQYEDFWRSVISGLGAAFLFLMLILLTKGKGMGMGDAKLALALGLVLGWPRVVIWLFSSFILGALVASLLIIFGRKRFGQTIPFGPFLVIGTIIALIWGQQFWIFYLKILYLA